MSETGTISEIELLAFVDGRISPESARYREIEDILHGNPELAARVAAYRQQNVALARAYGDIAEQPAPARLLNALETGASRTENRFKPGMRMAASLAAVLLSGGIGWYAGGLSGSADVDTALLIDVVRDSYLSPAGGDISTRNDEKSGFAEVMGGQGAVLDGVGIDRAALEMPAPDLTREGFSFVARERITRSEREMLALTYRNPEGENVRILIAPRLSQPQQPIRMERDGALSMGYWTDGALAIALIGRLDPDDTRALAESVRRRTALRLADEMPDPVIRHMPVEQEASVQGTPPGSGGAVPPAQPVSETVPEGG